jgi:hypothetical protein
MHACHLFWYCREAAGIVDPTARPSAGTTTTAESLYMGVPCITLTGACHAHNVGASLMAGVGMTEGWVVGSEDAYVEAAAAAASNLQARSPASLHHPSNPAAEPGLCSCPYHVEMREHVLVGWSVMPAGTVRSEGELAPAHARIEAL